MVPQGERMDSSRAGVPGADLEAGGQRNDRQLAALRTPPPRLIHRWAILKCSAMLP